MSISLVFSPLPRVDRFHLLCEADVSEAHASKLQVPGLFAAPEFVPNGNSSWQLPVVSRTVYPRTSSVLRLRAKMTPISAPKAGTKKEFMFPLTLTNVALARHDAFLAIFRGWCLPRSSWLAGQFWRLPFSKLKGNLVQWGVEVGVGGRISGGGWGFRGDTWAGLRVSGS